MLSLIERDPCRHQLTSHTKKDRRVIRDDPSIPQPALDWTSGMSSAGSVDVRKGRSPGMPIWDLRAIPGRSQRPGIPYGPYGPYGYGPVYGYIRYTSTLAILRGIVSENTQISFMPVSCSRCTYIPKKLSIHRPHSIHNEMVWRSSNCTWSNSKDCLKFDQSSIIWLLSNWSCRLSGQNVIKSPIWKNAI